jgi:hypothetical protein
LYTPQCMPISFASTMAIFTKTAPTGYQADQGLLWVFTGSVNACGGR